MSALSVMKITRNIEYFYNLPDDLIIYIYRLLMNKSARVIQNYYYKQVDRTNKIVMNITSLGPFLFYNGPMYTVNEFLIKCLFDIRNNIRSSWIKLDPSFVRYNILNIERSIKYASYYFIYDTILTDNILNDLKHFYFNISKYILIDKYYINCV